MPRKCPEVEVAQPVPVAPLEPARPIAARRLQHDSDNVVFQVVGYKNTGLVDRSGAAVPEAELVGEGEAWVLTGGRLVKGRWSRPSDGQTTTYTLPSGEPIRLTPGRTWLELVPLGNLKAL